MKLNRKWIMVLALVMSMAMATTGTLAYLTDRDSEANEFTMGNVKIDLKEDFEQGAELIPGVNIEKKPTITNTGKNDAWVWATVAVPAGLEKGVKITWAEAGWTEHGDATTVEQGGKKYTLFTYLYDKALAPNETTETPVMSSIKMLDSGMSYVGGIGGKNAYANWTDITMDADEGSYVKANSVENGTAYRTYVGGVIGFMGEGGHSFTNVTSNIDVYGSTCDIGGITGIAHYGNSFINCSSSGNVTITDAAEAGDAEEIGGIAGVWHNGGADVTFDGCSYTGKLSANITEGVNLTNNTIHGKAYSTTGSGKVIVK